MNLSEKEIAIPDWWEPMKSIRHSMNSLDFDCNLIGFYKKVRLLLKSLQQIEEMVKIGNKLPLGVAKWMTRRRIEILKRTREVLENQLSKERV